jgi:hypothetical protein
MTKPTNAKIQALEAKLKAAKAEAAAALRAAKKKEAEALAKTENRKKMVLGEFISNHMKSHDITPQKLVVDGVSFETQLTSDEDRLLFGLPPLTPQ